MVWELIPCKDNNIILTFVWKIVAISMDHVATRPRNVVNRYLPGSGRLFGTVPCIIYVYVSTAFTELVATYHSDTYNYAVIHDCTCNIYNIWMVNNSCLIINVQVYSYGLVCFSVWWKLIRTDSEGLIYSTCTSSVFTVLQCEHSEGLKCTMMCVLDLEQFL